MTSPIVFFFLSSGLFLGWSLGANNASTVFGTAVSTQMVRFSTAALILSVFVILGAVIGGAGATQGLTELGAVNAVGGAFTVSLAAALTVYWMTQLNIPVSISQAVVGAIIGWNFFSGSPTNLSVVLKIVSTWVACPVLSGLFSAVLYKSITWGLQRQKLHLLRLDSYTRWGLIVVGALASYALGANNIANVMGVFVPSDPFRAIAVGHLGEISAAQQLFLLGAIAIAVGVYTDSQKVMMTVGNNLMPLNPIGAFVVVLAEFIVLFIFSSSSLQHLFIQWGLPPIPLIPVSSAQAAVGAVMGVGLLKGAKGARQINWRVLQDIVSSWISTPIMAAVISFILLFVVQNVFDQPVYLR